MRPVVYRAGTGPPLPTMRTLTQRELNRALLARQGLLERFDRSLPRFIESVGGLQTQYAPSGYIGTWSRLEGFERGALTRALERRTVVQATLMRSTIHMVSRRDYWPIVTAVREHRRRWWLQATRHATSERELETWAGRIRDALADGPQRRSVLVKELGMDSTTWNGATGWLDLVRVPPSGTWERRRADLYGLGGGLDRSSACGPHPGRRPRPPGSALPHRVRPRLAQGHLELHRCAAPRGGCGARRDPHPAVPERGRGTARWTSRAGRSPIPQPPCRCGSCPPGTPRCSSTRAEP